MQLNQFLLNAVWTLLVIRILALRATLRVRTLAVFLLGSRIFVAVVQGFVNSYGTPR